MAKPHGKFTGRHMALIFACGFGIVIAVNLVMASVAVGSFHGTVVDNSYVASQNFNDWMAKAETSRALGWEVSAERQADGRIALVTSGVPEGAAITAFAERPLGARETAALGFAPAGADRWLSDAALAEGRWTLRYAVRADGREWAGEGELR